MRRWAVAKARLNQQGGFGEVKRSALEVARRFINRARTFHERENDREDECGPSECDVGRGRCRGTGVAVILDHIPAGWGVGIGVAIRLIRFRARYVTVRHSGCGRVVSVWDEASGDLCLRNAARRGTCVRSVVARARVVLGGMCREFLTTRQPWQVRPDDHDKRQDRFQYTSASALGQLHEPVDRVGRYARFGWPGRQIVYTSWRTSYSGSLRLCKRIFAHRSGAPRSKRVHGGRALVAQAQPRVYSRPCPVKRRRPDRRYRLEGA